MQSKFQGQNLTQEASSPVQLPLFSPLPAVSDEVQTALAQASKYSNWVVYVDESGNYNTDSYTNEFPVFVLAFCIFHKDNYVKNVVGELEKFKFEYFGHDLVVLHEREIRKEIGAFQFPNKTYKNNFIGALHTILDAANFITISCSINKKKLAEHNLDIGDNLYHVALRFCLESLFDFVTEKRQTDCITHIIFEARGKRKDRDLELEFRRICHGSNEKRKASRLCGASYFLSRRRRSIYRLLMPHVLGHEPREQCRGEELPEDGFEVGQAARQRMQRGNVAVAGSRDRRQREVGEVGGVGCKRAGTIDRWPAEGVRNDHGYQTIGDGEQSCDVQVEENRPTYPVHRDPAGSEDVASDERRHASVEREGHHRDRLMPRESLNMQIGAKPMEKRRTAKEQHERRHHAGLNDAMANKHTHADRGEDKVATVQQQAAQRGSPTKRNGQEQGQPLKYEERTQPGIYQALTTRGIVHRIIPASA